jgi:hypothetical protein
MGEKLKLIEMVTIPTKEYESLLDDSLLLQCLENAGVDNWSEGYGYAMEEYHRIKGDE